MTQAGQSSQQPQRQKLPRDTGEGAQPSSSPAPTPLHALLASSPPRLSPLETSLSRNPDHPGCDGGSLFAQALPCPHKLEILQPRNGKAEDKAISPNPSDKTYLLLSELLQETAIRGGSGVM